MPRPDTDTPVLFQWTLDALAWDAFAHAVHAHPHRSRMKLRSGSAADRTVIVTDDAIRVGRDRIDLKHFHVHRVIEHGHWLQLAEVDPDALPCPLPLPQGDPDLAARLVEHFRALADRHSMEWARLVEQAEAESRRPTLSNRIRWLVERHFIACLLVFFFVVLPLGSMLVARFVGE